MTKKFLYGLMSAIMLFAASCTNDVEQLSNEGKTTTVSFKVSTPEIASRAFGDGETATKLNYATYIVNDEDVTLLEDESLTSTTTIEDKKVTLNLNLVTGLTYKVVFWAAAEDAPYTFNAKDKKVTVNYDNATSNAENRDAFYHCEEFTVESADTKTVKLKRPFAQLNIGTSDLVFAEKAGMKVTHSYVKVANVYGELDLMTGKATGNQAEQIFEYAEIPTNETYPVTGYEYLAMNYLLVGELAENGDKALVDVTFSYAEKDAEGNTVNEFSRTVGSVPVQRNHRTNIYGKLLTSTTDINVEIKPAFDDQEELVYVWDGSEVAEPAIVNEDGRNIYVINYASELAWLAAAVNGTLTEDYNRSVVAPNDFAGKTFRLAKDIDLGGNEWTPIGMGGNHFKATFDGKGKTIYGLKISERPNGTSQAALFGTVSGTVEISDLTIKGAEINGLEYKDEDFYGSALIGTMYGYVTIKNVNVVNSYISGNNKVGALVAHDGVCSSFIVDNCIVDGCTFESTNIADGGLVGGLVGYFQGAAPTATTVDPYGKYNIKNSHVKNSTFNVVNSTNTGKRANSQFIGGIDSKAGQEIYINDCSVENNQWTEKFYVNSVEVTQEMYKPRYVANNIAWIGGERDDIPNGKVYINNKLYVTSAAELQAAINAAEGETTIYLGYDIEGTVTAVQKPGVKITIDGEGKKYNGSIKIHSNSEHYADAALTIKNVNFETSVASVNVIEALENGAERYSANITVEKCTFKATGEAVNTSVGVQIKSSKNAKVINCTANNMHSLLQANSCDESVLVQNCTINNGKNGVAFTQVKAATVEGSTINATNFGIRFNGNTDNYGIVVKNNNVTANQPLIVRKMTGKDNTIALEGTNTLTTEAEYQIVITNGSDDEEYVKPTGTYTLTGADGYTQFPAPFEVATWDEFTQALAAGEDWIKLTDNISNATSYSLFNNVLIDLNEKTLEISGSTYRLDIGSKNDGSKPKPTVTIKNGNLNCKVYAQTGNLTLADINFGGSIAYTNDAQGVISVGSQANLLAERCDMSKVKANAAETRPRALSSEGRSSGYLILRDCNFPSSGDGTGIFVKNKMLRTYITTLSGNATLEITKCKFGVVANIDLAASYVWSNMNLTGCTAGFTFTISRVSTSFTEDENAFMKNVKKNNTGDVRLDWTDVQKMYIK